MERYSKTLGKNSKYGENIDKCLKDLVVKTGAGILVGGVAALLFKRRVWPMTLGGGVGIGMAYTTCENRFQQVLDKNVEVSKENVPSTFSEEENILSPAFSSAIKSEEISTEVGQKINKEN